MGATATGDRCTLVLFVLFVVLLVVGLLSVVPEVTVLLLGITLESLNPLKDSLSFSLL